MNTVVTDPVTMAYHELRSPLALVATMARTAAADCEDLELRARCESIVSAAERMLRTAGHLMVVAQASESSGSSVFDARDVLRSVATDYRNMGVQVQLELDSCEPIFLEASPVQFEALLCSLLGNSTDHGDVGQVVLRADVRAGRCEVRIENTIGRSFKHRGLGLGSYIGNKLAGEMSATLSTIRTEHTYAAIVSIPVAVRMPVAV